FADDSGEYNVGASVTVEIAYEEVADAIQVPSLAVTTADGTSTVEVQTDGGTETRTVTTGLTAGTMTQITDGLDAGESVVITLPGARGGGDEEDGSDVGTGGGGFGPPEGFTPPEGGQGPGFGGGS
ncbi:MAG: hypothetical protein KDA97_14045, partial [Acidimicrobiales bacterium]|nr:hypothetical protein [Acidimicrobiales bacterium]